MAKPKKSRNGYTHPWLKEEEEYIRENYMYMSDKELSEELDRSESAVTSCISRLGIKRGQRCKLQILLGEIFSELALPSLDKIRMSGD